MILTSMNLTECHGMAISGDPMCRLYVVRKGHSHEAVYDCRRDRGGPQVVSLQGSASSAETTMK